MGEIASPIRVLHVDDQPDIAELVATYLENENDDFVVESVTRAREVLDRLHDPAFDCLVSDYDLNEMTGLELFEEVQAEYPDLPVILFTGKGSEEVASEAISAGVTDYLQKGTGTDQYTILANRIRNAVERTQAELERKRSNRRFEAIFDDPDQLVGILTRDGTLTKVNETAVEYFGEDLADAVGDPFWEISIWNDVPRDEVRTWVEQAADGEYVDFEASYDSTDGGPRYLVGTVRPVRNDDGQVTSLVVSARDITERRQLETEIMEKATLLDQIFEQVPIHLYVKDTEGRHVRFSHWYLHDEPVVSPDETIGKTDLEIYDEELGRQTHEDDMQVIENEEPVIDRVEYVPTVDGWNLTSKAPLYDSDGEVRGLIGVSRNFTERKETRERLERQNERLEKLIRSVSHDLKNPLNVAKGNLEIAREMHDAPELARVDDALERMEALLEDTIALARKGERIQECVPVSLDEIATDCWTSVATGEATLSVPTNATIRADVNRLRQLLENLIGNAVTHGSPAPTVRVNTLADGRGFFVADDGPGIPVSERDRVFDLGYSTAADGTGFGLGIVEEIVEAHDWSIHVTESADGGVRFEITDVEFVSES